MVSRGRVPGRPLTELEIRHLRQLMESQERARASARLYTHRLEDFVLELRDSGASAQGIADAIDVGKSTVQSWKDNASRRRGA